MAEGQQDDTSNPAFSTADEDKQGETAGQGGQGAPNDQRSFSQDPERAAEAGGESVPEEERSFSQDPGQAADAGGGDKDLADSDDDDVEDDLTQEAGGPAAGV